MPYLICPKRHTHTGIGYPLFHNFFGAKELKLAKFCNLGGIPKSMPIFTAYNILPLKKQGINRIGVRGSIDVLLRGN